MYNVYPHTKNELSVSRLSEVAASQIDAQTAETEDITTAHLQGGNYFSTYKIDFGSFETVTLLSVADDTDNRHGDTLTELSSPNRSGTGKHSGRHLPARKTSSSPADVLSVQSHSDTM